MRPTRRQSALVVSFLLCVLFVAALFTVNVTFPLIIATFVAGLTLLIQVLPYFNVSGRLRLFIGATGKFNIYDQTQPRFRYVDYYRAIRRFAATAQRQDWVEAYFPAQPALGGILAAGAYLQTQQPERRRICVAYETYDYFANEVFCLITGPEGGAPTDRLLIRLAQRQYADVLEVAAADVQQAAGVMARLNQLAAEHSIYRGQFLEIRPNNQPLADYGYSVQLGELTVKFKQRPLVTDKDIVLDERIHAILRRTLFDFFRHRDKLQALGLPKKRTLLLYGPPGTGKTHTCRYVQTMLDNITTVQVSGQAVVQLSEIGKLARQLHPALVILEDIDLAFTQREINVYATVLGELMDQLDGFTEDEEVLFIMTTNAIERVEAAIRERPGRVNQCLYFGLPDADLRRLFLTSYLNPYQKNGLDLDHLVRQTDKTSQAFLKEYVHRAVQVAAAAASYDKANLKLETHHFDTAFDELTSHGDPHGHAIMGFHRPR